MRNPYALYDRQDRVQDGFLSGLSFEDIFKTITDPNTKVPTIPVTYSMDKSDKIILGVGLGLIAAGLFVNAYVNSPKKNK